MPVTNAKEGAIHERLDWRLHAVALWFLNESPQPVVQQIDKKLSLLVCSAFKTEQLVTCLSHRGNCHENPARVIRFQRWEERAR